MRDFDDYIADVRRDAEKYVEDFGAFAFDLSELMYECRIKVTGDGAGNGFYLGDEDRAIEAIGTALWDERFKDYLQAERVREVVMDSPLAVDSLVRCAAFSDLEEEILEMAKAAFGDGVHGADDEDLEDVDRHRYGSFGEAIELAIKPFLGDFVDDFDVDGIAQDVCEWVDRGNSLYVVVNDITHEVLDRHLIR